MTGTIGLVGDRLDAHLLLQVVPVIGSAHVTSVASDGSTVNVQLRGAGFVEGNNSVYTFGSTSLIDVGNGSNPIDVGYFFAQPNDGVNVNAIPLGPGFSGPVTVTTAGGTSAPYVVSVINITATALSGIPADASKPSANPGQVVALTGSGLSTATDIIATYLDSAGTLHYVTLNPYYSNASGTEADLVVPNYFNGVTTFRFAGASAAASLQIVPVLQAAYATGANSVQLRGRGFVEGNNSTYTLPGLTLTDTSISSSPIDVGYFFAFDNDGVNLSSLGAYGAGSMTVTTAGGTSGPATLNGFSLALGRLSDVAAEPGAGGKVWVATDTQLVRIEPTTGATLKTIAFPGGSNGGYAGLQVLPTAMTLAGVAVPSGSLLATNGVINPDKVYAIDPATGLTLATLTLPNLDAVAGVYDPGTGHLFVLTQGGVLDEVNPATGSVLKTVTSTLGSGGGGLALDPSSGELWVGMTSGFLGGNVVELVRRSDGAVLRSVDVTQGGGLGTVDGLSIDGSGRFLVASYNYGLISSSPTTSTPVATTVQPTITAILGTSLDGTPANAAVASANVAQTVTAVGTGFTYGTSFYFPTRDNAGNPGLATVNPYAVSGDGTRAQLIVPDLATTGAVTAGPAASPNLGFNGNGDAVFRGLSTTFTAGGSAASLAFFDRGLPTGGTSWGIDNVKVVDGSNATVYATDFESGAGSEWSNRTTDATYPGSFTHFLGRFTNVKDVLSLSGLTAGASYTLSFDVFAIDGWVATTPPTAPTR